MARTLGSLDPAWIQRCQESPKKREFPKNWEFPREKEELDPGSVGNSGRKRPRESGDTEETPAKLRRGLEIPKKSGIRKIRDEREEEEEEESQNAPGKIPGKAENLEKPKAARKTR